MTLQEFNKNLPVSNQADVMPTLFIGHGSPMNAIEDNAYARSWQTLGKELPKPSAILCISAHWLTRGTFVTAVEKPKTIHDFGGFPKALFDVQYPAPGSLELAQATRQSITSTPVGLDHEWGPDHGAWSVLKHVYPQADVPVVEMSLDYGKPLSWHYELAKELAALRRKGVLIVGSGNIVHNLRMVSWHTPKGFDWAEEANEKIKRLIQAGDHQALIHYASLGREVQLAIPTPDHYLPLLYTLGLQEASEQATFFNDETLLGSLSMTSVKLGKAV